MLAVSRVKKLLHYWHFFQINYEKVNFRKKQKPMNILIAIGNEFLVDGEYCINKKGSYLFQIRYHFVQNLQNSIQVRADSQDSKSRDTSRVTASIQILRKKTEKSIIHSETYYPTEFKVS